VRTTVDIAEPLLRKARSKAALEGIRMADVVNQALIQYLEYGDNSPTPSNKLPKGIQFETFGQFTLPVIQPKNPGTRKIGQTDLKEAEIDEDLERHAKVFGR
jgi:hypothetical protein